MEKTDKDLEVFKMLHKTTGDVIDAWNNEEELENAMGRFILLMLQLDALK
jgi:hypothetical protein